MSAAKNAFLSLSPQRAREGADLPLPPPRRWLALARKVCFWQIPFYGTTWETVPEDTQFLLWEKQDGSFGVVIPLIDGDWRSSLRGAPGGLSFDHDAGILEARPTRILAAYIAHGSHPGDLARSAMAAIATKLKTFRLREEKPVPAFLNVLGWCTWDAFYHEVSQANVRKGLSSLARAGIHPGFLVLDDGWLDTTGDLLNDFAAHPKKFPKGLAPTIAEARAKFGIRHFGIWHAFQGYWAGVNPDGALAARFRILRTTGRIRPWEDKVYDLGLVDPEQIAAFYHTFYRWLRGQGVDFVKTDGQSAFDQFSGKTLGRVSTMARFQEALQGAALTHFAASPIHCMSNGSDVALQFMSSNVWRNSDDYYPRQPLEMQQWHVHQNAINNVWTRTFAIPDWDMFQTHGPVPEFHAAARALSGGPIYICDKPGKHDAAVVEKLVVSHGSVLRFPEPAQPSLDGLFTDFRVEEKLLKIANRVGGIGALGLFHCTAKAVEIRDSFRPSDIPGLPRGEYAVYLHRLGTVHLLGFDSRLEIKLAQAEFEIATCSPLIEETACFGLLDKYNSAVAIQSWSVLGREAEAVLRDGGRIGFYAARKPKSVTVNGKATRFVFHAKNKLLVVKARVGAPAQIRLRLA